MSEHRPGTPGESAAPARTQNDDVLGSVELARSWLAPWRKLEPAEQRRRLLSLLRPALGAPPRAQRGLEAVIEIDEAWYPVAAELSRRARQDPAPAASSPAGLHEEMAELSLALAGTYAGFVDELAAEGADGVQDTRLLRVVALALFHYGQLAKFLYCRNETPHADFWRRVHGLYVLAKNLGFAGKPLALYVNEEVIVTCSQVWLRTIMLATAATGELTPRQLNRTEEWLLDWCKRIAVDTAYDASRHLYCVDVAASCGPQRATTSQTLEQPLFVRTDHLHEDILAARLRLIDISVVSTIGRYIDNPLKEYSELLDRLQRMWVMALSAGTQRASVRSRGREGESIEVVRGFAAILAAAGSGSGKPGFESCSLIDRSESGFGLLDPHSEGRGPRLFELVAVRTEDTPEWMIGFVARTTTLPQGQGNLIGVQVLAGTAVVVSIERTPTFSEVKPDRLALAGSDTGVGTQRQPVLFLLGNAARNQADSLLAPKSMFAPGDRLTLKTATNAFVIRVNRVVQSGEDWERTGFQVLQKLPAALPRSHGSPHTRR